MCIGILISGCDGLFKSEPLVAKDDVLLAAIGDRRMYLSEIDEMINASTSADSLNQVNTYIESWLKQNVLLNEAEAKFPDNVDIDKMVDDYRSSLLLYNYRQKLIEEALDTSISREQESEYYNSNMEQYLLQTPICKGRIAQVPDNAPKLEKFYRSWKKSDSTAVFSYLEKHATSSIDQLDKWISVDQFLSMLPKGLFQEKDLMKKGDLQKHKDTYEYFIKIYDVVDKSEIAPLDYVRENIRKVIIHKRKQELLENIEQDLYEDYLTANKIRVYSK